MNKRDYVIQNNDRVVNLIRGLIKNIKNGSVSVIKQDSVIIQINTREIFSPRP